MFIPMGTIVTVCMLITVVFANRFPGFGLNRVTPAPVLRVIGIVTGAAGLWNILWYGLQHIGEFWGHMALGSGVVMTLLSAMLVLSQDKIPPVLNIIRPFAVLALAGFAIYYGLTIYNL